MLIIYKINIKVRKIMNEEYLRSLPINDTFSQCINNLLIEPKEAEKIKNEIENCNHLFVLLEKGEKISGCHSTDYYYNPDKIECVHCGLTNKFKKIEDTIITTGDAGLLLLPHQKKKTLQSEMWEKIFATAYSSNGKYFDNSKVNLISKEPLLTNHPRLLYECALEINPIGDVEELFEIMKALNFLETYQERIRFQTKEQANSLIERYYSKKTSKLVLTKKQYPTR